MGSGSGMGSGSLYHGYNAPNALSKTFILGQYNTNIALMPYAEGAGNGLQRHVADLLTRIHGHLAGKIALPSPLLGD